SVPRTVGRRPTRRVRSVPDRWTERIKEKDGLQIGGRVAGGNAVHRGFARAHSLSLAGVRRRRASAALADGTDAEYRGAGRNWTRPGNDGPRIGIGRSGQGGAARDPGGAGTRRAHDRTDRARPLLRAASLPAARRAFAPSRA